MSKVARYRRQKRKNKNLLIRILSWFVSLGIIAGAVLFVVAFYYEDTKVKFEELSYPCDYSELVNKFAETYDLDPALIYAVIRTESGFDPQAQSSAGACGIMQIMPSSFEWLQEKRGEANKYTTDDLYNPEICIDYGSYLLKYFYDLYGTEQCAVAAYNAGFVVGDWLNDSNYSTDGVTLSYIPYPETSNYVEKVESVKEMYIKLYYS